jgi:LruC domain-containing protein
MRLVNILIFALIYSFKVHAILVTIAEDPGQQTSTVAGVEVFSFDTLEVGYHENIVWDGVGQFSELLVQEGYFGFGAYDSTDGLNSRFNWNGWRGYSGSETLVSATVLQLDERSSYFGLYWSAGDGDDIIQFYDGDTLVAEFSTSTIVQSASLTSAHYGDPNHKNQWNPYLNYNHTEPYAFINFYGSETIKWNKIVLTQTHDLGSGFETDNISSRVEPVLSSTDDISTIGDAVAEVSGTETTVVSNETISWDFTASGDADSDGIPNYLDDDDIDNDGASDDEDDYPFDSNKAFDNYYPARDTYGTYAFEDRWPEKGDYDFNDVVLNYNYKYVTDTTDKISEIIMKFKILATGASYDNGLMIRLNIPQSNIDRVEGAKIFHEFLSIRDNGTELGNTDAVIPITDNINKIHGSFNNVYENDIYVESTEFEVRVVFSTSIMISPFEVDPFIIINKDRGREVHMKGQSPTLLANLSYFDTYDDRSSTYLNYSDINGMPWGLDFPDSFKYLKEKEDLSSNYLRFSSWANSAGDKDDDWYFSDPDLAGQT